MYGKCLRCDKPSTIRVYYKGEDMTKKRYKLIESDPCEDPYDCRMYVGILVNNVEELYDYKSICDRLNELSEENEQLKSENERLCNFNLHMLLDEKNKEIEQLKSEISMLKTTIGRNEGYIDRLTHKGEWR